METIYYSDHLHLTMQKDECGQHRCPHRHDLAMEAVEMARRIGYMPKEVRIDSACINDERENCRLQIKRISK